MAAKYRIATSELWDWFEAWIGDKRLYRGHDLDDAYAAILADAGIDVPIEESIPTE